jgi:hypothetical protein
MAYTEIMDAIEQCHAKDVATILTRAFGMPSEMSAGDAIVAFWLLRHVPFVRRGIDKMLACPDMLATIRALFVQELDTWFAMHAKFASWATLVIDDNNYRRASLVDDVFELHLISADLRTFVKDFLNSTTNDLSSKLMVCKI